MLGVDFAGTVESVGPRVADFKPGDNFLGGANGAFAEYVSVRAQGPVVRKPAKLTLDQAGSVIDRCYELSRVPDAMDYMGEGHARGKIVVRVRVGATRSP